MTSSGELQLPPAGSFPPDIWNTCPGSEVNNLTEFSQPSAPSGDPYTDGERTSGILLHQEYLDSPIGDGLPFASSYSVTFPNPGTYSLPLRDPSRHDRDRGRPPEAAMPL